MLKGLLLMLTIAGSLASAETLTPLQIPDSVPVSGTSHCAGLTFGASPTDIISGYCSSYKQLGGCGRSCQYVYTVLAVEWDPTLRAVGDRYPVIGLPVVAATSAVVCGTALKPGALPLVWIYAAGYSAADCQLPPTSAVKDRLIGYQWYGEIATDGAYELLLNGQQGTLGTF